MKKRMLALAVMSTVFSVGFVMSANAAENADQKLSQYSVDEVIVEGSRDLLPGGFVKSGTVNSFAQISSDILAEV